MSVYTDDIPPGVIRLRIRGEFKLNRAPHGEVDGWQFFHLNAATVDWADSCNAARAQLFPGVQLPVVDMVFEEIMQARRDGTSEDEPRQRPMRINSDTFIVFARGAAT